MDDDGDSSKQRADDWVICKCSICNGIHVPLRTKRQHSRIFEETNQLKEDLGRTSKKSFSMDKTRAVEDYGADPKIDNGVFEMTILTEALDEVEEDDHEAVSHTQSDQAVFEKLWDIDEGYRLHDKFVLGHISDMDKAVRECDPVNICAFKSAIQADQYGFQSQLEALRCIDCLGDKAHELWKAALETSIEDRLRILRESKYVDDLKVFEPTDSEMKSVNTNDYLGKHLHSMNPLILIPILLVISLNLFAHVSREWCNSTLRVLRLYAKFAIRDASNWTAQSSGCSTGSSAPPNDSTSLPTDIDGRFSDLQSLLQNFPVDLRTLMERFGVRAKIDVYAVCPDPKCCSVYPPFVENGHLSYPRTCTKVHLRKRVEKECGALLCVDGVSGGKSIRVPIKSFPVQDWDDFKARMVVNPLILTLLRRGMKCAIKDEMGDIKDGKHLASLTGVDGKPFMNGSNKELRLAWSLSTDWFNPFHNHIAGKQASVGSIAMTCLNLPPTFRFKPEYVFLAGVIPGPDEPRDDLTNNFLDIVVDQLEKSYAHGTYYSTTYVFPGGIIERSIVAVFVFDLPGARKCCGMQSHSSKRNFCHLCRLPKADINNLDVSSWVLRDRATHMSDALAWKAEPVKTKKNKMFSRTGVRWSPFLRLPYFHPHQSLIVDGMHNLFLGLCMYHVRDFLGIDVKAEETSRKLKTKVNIKQLAKARTKLKEEPGISTIKSFPFPILRALCDENEVLLDVRGLGARTKDLQQALLSKVQPRAESVREVVDFTTGLIGDGYFEESTPTRLVHQISSEELKQIHLCLSSTVRPRWHKAPPSNLGEARHGKLKADQWRSLMEFDLPVALAQIWKNDSERQQLYHITMLLAIAMRFATSYTVTKHHIDQYKKYILEYLMMLRRIDPRSNLRPNHHEALHIPDYLELFGPMHGWWMFVYERVIGLLQNINTNYKIGGQLETTMLESFCAAANFRGFLKRVDLPKSVREVADAIDLPEDIRGTLLQNSHHDFGKTSQTKIRRLDREKEKTSTLDDDVIYALRKITTQVAAFINQPWSPPTYVVKQERAVIGGRTFSVEKTTKSTSLICIHNGDTYVPGRLREIFSIAYPDSTNDQLLNVLFFFVVHQHLPVAPRVYNPFASYPDFGANLWSIDCYTRPSVVPLLPDIKLCHGIFQKWDEKHIVAKALDRDVVSP